MLFFGILLALNLRQLMKYTGTGISGRLIKRLLRKAWNLPEPPPKKTWRTR